MSMASANEVKTPGFNQSADQDDFYADKFEPPLFNGVNWEKYLSQSLLPEEVA
jgi:hypothetical protein